MSFPSVVLVRPQSCIRSGSGRGSPGSPHRWPPGEFDFAKLLADPEGLRSNLIDYISRFSSNIDVFERFKFENELATLDEKGRLYLVVSKFAEVDLHPDTVPNAPRAECLV